jgi:hypothetical protein
MPRGVALDKHGGLSAPMAWYLNPGSHRNVAGRSPYRSMETQPLFKYKLFDLTNVPGIHASRDQRPVKLVPTGVVARDPTSAIAVNHADFQSPGTCHEIDIPPKRTSGCPVATPRAMRAPFYAKSGLQLQVRRPGGSFTLFNAVNHLTRRYVSVQI